MANQSVWYYAENDQTQGPVPLEKLVETLSRLSPGESLRTLIFGPGMTDWTEARHVAQVAALLPKPRANREVSIPVVASREEFDSRTTPATAATVARAGDSRSGDPLARAGVSASSSGKHSAGGIDYEIFGEEMQYVVITLDPGEKVIAEAGVMMFMSESIKMETKLGDPSKQDQGFFGKVLSAGKRVLTGESLFVTVFSNPGPQRQQIALASPYPGRIIPLHLDELGGELICQRDSFVCATMGTEIGIAFQKKFSVGLFGGEGFIMQRLRGQGVAMIHAGGALLRRTLNAGEMLKVDTGCLAALQPSVTYDIQMVGGVKNALFGGEGLFLATLTGPGDVWLQSLPFSRLAGRIVSASGSGKEESGNVLGSLGSLLMGSSDT